MHKFFIPQENIDGETAVIDGEDVKHIYKVLRLEEGDQVSLNDCQGADYLAEITDVNKKEVTLRIIKKLETTNESPIEIHLYQGLPKSQKMDLIAQKATELGVREITPVITGRVIVKSELGEYKKLDRWNRIALEASKQSKRTLIPKINHPVEFVEMLKELKGMDLILVPYENQEGKGLRKVCRDIDRAAVKKAAIVIGPEGGFEPAEIEMMESIGAEVITLGPRILRTETAGFVCAALLLYELGDLGGIL